jgi:glycosyltransferase involved in cell wall biosynthesis
MKSNSQDNVVYLIDSRGVITPDNIDSQQRHKKYAYELAQRSPRNRFIVITSSKNSNLTNFENNFSQYFVKSNNRFSLFYILRAVQIISKSRRHNSILIAGDPWESAMTSRVISKILKKSFGIYAPLQVQIHADVMDPTWKNATVINRVRYLSLARNLNKSEQLRVVSESLKKEIVSKKLVQAERVIVSPVELNLPNKQIEVFSDRRPRSIGFAGRFHKDRGISDFVDYVRRINPEKNDVNVILAGEGPLLKNLVAELKGFMNPTRVKYCGNLSSDEMLKFWREVGVYVSLAKSESYGRSIREAAYLGIPVLGAKSNGFYELLKADVSWVREVESFENSEALLNQLNCLLSIKTDYSVQKYFETQSKINLNILIDSWIKLLGTEQNQ